MVNYLRLMEDVNRAFRKQYGHLANPRDYPKELQSIIETCTDMLEEEANNHDYEEVSDEEDHT